jgi:hypothetical protein
LEIEINNQFENLGREDVVSVYSGLIFVNNRTFTVSEFITAIMQMHKQKVGELTEGKENWFNEGIDCKILKPGAKSWQRGKVRISLEFEPEDIEVTEAPENSQLKATKAGSPLDDIRQMIPKE